MEDLVSIIVPVYNVEAYLDRCVQSLVDQTYTNIEIILVDDGSPDNCPAMCDAWAEKDGRIRVLHQPNGGVSKARNTGMAAAVGEYISFVDSDDWVESDFLRILYDTIQSEQCGVVGCAHRLVYDESVAPPDNHPPYNMTRYSTCEAAMAALIADKIRQIPVNKLYAKGIISDIPFEEGKRHEDDFWSYQVFARVDHYVEIDYIGYNYLQQSGSFMSHYSLQRLDAVDAKIQRQRFLEAEMPSLASQGRINLQGGCIYQGQLVLKNLQGEEKKLAISRLKEAVKSWPLTREDKKSLRFTHRLWAEMMDVSFVLTCWLRNLLGVGF